jgi:hypothetical protein
VTEHLPSKALSSTPNYHQKKNKKRKKRKEKKGEGEETETKIPRKLEK